jgi:hypothetical protein
MGLSAGTKFFLPFEDSTDIKAGIDYLKSVGAGGIMFYDFYGDRRSGQTENWRRAPYIYAASIYAASLASGGSPSYSPTTQEESLPIVSSLFQNYPNPFNPSTKIDFTIPVAGYVMLKVFDLLGREVATLLNEEKSSGTYHVTFHASKLTSGVYFYRLSVKPMVRGKFASFTETKRFVLLK